MYVCGGVQTKYQMLHSLWWGHKTSLIKLKILQVENRFSTPDYWTSQLDLTYLHVIRTLGLQLDIVKGYLPHIAGGEIKIQNTVCTECIPIFQNSKSRAIGSWGGHIEWHVPTTRAWRQYLQQARGSFTSARSCSTLSSHIGSRELWEIRLASCPSSLILEVKGEALWVPSLPASQYN